MGSSCTRSQGRARSGGKQRIGWRGHKGRIISEGGEGKQKSGGGAERGGGVRELEQGEEGGVKGKEREWGGRTRKKKG